MKDRLRVTVSIDKEVDKKLRTLQAKLLTESNRNWSYSRTLESVVDEGLKKYSVSKHTK